MSCCVPFARSPCTEATEGPHCRWTGGPWVGRPSGAVGSREEMKTCFDTWDWVVGRREKWGRDCQGQKEEDPWEAARH